MNAKLIVCHTNKSGFVLYYEDGTMEIIEANLEKPPTQQIVEEDLGFTKKQNRLYGQVVHGVSWIDPSERRRMARSELDSIQASFIKAQREINRLKNERMEEIIRAGFSSVFKISREIRPFFKSCGSKYDYLKNTLDLSFLGVDKYMIVKRLVATGILQSSDFSHLFQSPQQAPVQKLSHQGSVRV